MIPNAYSSRHSGRQSMQDRSSTKAGGSSSASSSRPSQAQLGGGYASRTTYLRETTEHESELGHLLSPPSPPPPLEQILSGRPSNSGSPRPIPTVRANSYQSLYDDIERELFAEPSSSAPQPDANATSRSSSRYENLYDSFAQASSAAPVGFNSGSNSSSRQQSVANQSTSSTTSEVSPSRYPGVHYHRARGKWRVVWRDPFINQKVWLGEYVDRNEAIRVLEDYKASQREQFPQRNVHPGVYRTSVGTWMAKYSVQRRQIYVGTFNSQEEAARALHQHRAERRLPPMSDRR